MFYTYLIQIIFSYEILKFQIYRIFFKYSNYDVEEYQVYLKKLGWLIFINSKCKRG